LLAKHPGGRAASGREKYKEPGFFAEPVLSEVEGFKNDPRNLRPSGSASVSTQWGGDELFSLMPPNFQCYISLVCVSIPILAMTLSGKSTRNEITLPK